MRALATILAIALEVALIILVVGLTQGMIKETTSRMAGIGADIVFRPPNSSAVLASSSAILPVEKFTDLLEGVDGVGEIAPVLVFWNTEKGSEFIFGIDYESFDQVSHGFIFRAGGQFQSDHDVIIDDVKADSKKLKVGDELQFLNERFRIAGIVEHGKGSRVFVPITTLERLIGSPGKATLMLINSTASTAVAQTVANLQKRLPGYEIRSMGEFVSQMSEAYSSEAALKYFLGIVKFIAISVGVFAIFLAMYATISERTREIGILKSLGASKQYILWVFLQEALLLCLIGLVVGVGFSFLGVWLVKQWSRSLIILLTWQWMVNAGLIAIFSALIGSLYPSLRAAHRDPIDALGYE
jgi:putative ABC transport system permease protein